MFSALKNSPSGDTLKYILKGFSISSAQTIQVLKHINSTLENDAAEKASLESISYKILHSDFLLFVHSDNFSEHKFRAYNKFYTDYLDKSFRPAIAANSLPIPFGVFHHYGGSVFARMTGQFFAFWEKMKPTLRGTFGIAKGFIPTFVYTNIDSLLSPATPTVTTSVSELLESSEQPQREQTLVFLDPGFSLIAGKAINTNHLTAVHALCLQYIENQDSLFRGNPKVLKRVFLKVLDRLLTEIFVQKDTLNWENNTLLAVQYQQIMEAYCALAESFDFQHTSLENLKSIRAYLEPRKNDPVTAVNFSLFHERLESVLKELDPPKPATKKAEKKQAKPQVSFVKKILLERRIARQRENIKETKDTFIRPVWMRSGPAVFYICSLFAKKIGSLTVGLYSTGSTFIKTRIAVGPATSKKVIQNATPPAPVIMQNAKQNTLEECATTAFKQNPHK